MLLHKALSTMKCGLCSKMRDIKFNWEFYWKLCSHISSERLIDCKGPFEGMERYLQTKWSSEIGFEVSFNYGQYCHLCISGRGAYLKSVLRRGLDSGTFACSAILSSISESSKGSTKNISSG